MKIKTISVIVLLTVCADRLFAQAQKRDEVRFLIDTTIDIMQKRSLYADNVKWSEVKINALRQSAGITDPYKMGNVIRYLLKAANEFHGNFNYGDSTFKWLGKPVIASDSVTKEVQNKVIRIRIFQNVGYIKVPTMWGPDKKAFDVLAQKLNDSLCNVLKPGLKAFIVDLRGDGGGSVHPMILGLKQLLGDGKMESFHAKNKPTDEILHLKGNDIMDNATVIASITPKCTVDAHKVPVVVLIGPGTGSSGEFLAIAFKGRPQTQFIGEATAGYDTSPITITIDHMAKILLTISTGVDRNGVAYDGPISPDLIKMGRENFSSPQNDELVKAALSWINKQR